MRFFVDGNNVMGSRPDGWWRNRGRAARRLLEQVAALARTVGGEWTVVFDNPSREVDAAMRFEGVTVEYAARPGRNGADDHIVRLLLQQPTGSDVVLYTSDRGLRERAEAAGARVEGARSLLAQLEGSTLAQSPGLTVRPATPGDAPLLLAFVHGIAEYEGLTHQVVATEESLRTSLAGAPPQVEALLGFVDGEPAGFATYFHTYSTFLTRRGMYLEDIYVSPEHRRRGLGTALLRRVAAITVERGCGRFEWAALDWNVDAHRFYERLGAEMLSEWRLFRVTGEALRRLAEG